MRVSIFACAFFATIALGRPAQAAQDLDAPRADAAHHKVELENEWVRVVRWSIPPTRRPRCTTTRASSACSSPTRT